MFQTTTAPSPRFPFPYCQNTYTAASIMQKNMKKLKEDLNAFAREAVDAEKRRERERARPVQLVELLPAVQRLLAHVAVPPLDTRGLAETRLFRSFRMKHFTDQSHHSNVFLTDTTHCG